MKLAELAQKLSCRLEGPPELEISGVAGMERAEPGQLTFLANRKYFALLKTTRASAILMEEGVAIDRDPSQPSLAALRSANPYLAFAQAIELFYQAPKYAPGIHPTAVIAKTAKIGEGAHIGPCCYIDEEAEIGRNAVLHSFVTIYRGAKIGDDFVAHAHAVVREHCRIGNHVILQNGAVIGGDGFGFAKRQDGTWYKMVQSGPAVLEDDVEVQSNACVDRATVGETRIRRGAKLDDLVLVATLRKSAPIRCSAAKSALRVQPRSATPASWLAKWGPPATSPSAMAPSLPRRAACPMTFPHMRSIRAIPP